MDDAQIINTPHRDVCKCCNAYFGTYDCFTVVDSLCPACGEEGRMVEPIKGQEEKSLSFDLWIQGKENAVARHNGFVLSPREVEGLSEEQVRELFVKKAARAMVSLLNKENIGRWLRR